MQQGRHEHYFSISAIPIGLAIRTMGRVASCSDILSEQPSGILYRDLLTEDSTVQQ